MQGMQGRMFAAAFAALLAVPATALAQDRGAYIGGGVGQSSFNDFCEDVGAAAAALGGTISSCDDKDSAWKIYGGYRFNRNFAVEGTYIDFGGLSVTGPGGTVRADATGIGGAAVGILPLSERFSLFGKIGLLSTEGDVRGAGAFGTISESTSDTGLHIGVGATFDITPAFAIRAEWEREDENEIDVTTIGLQFRF